jgi:multidrug efflux pump subunit AcrA (membrane-fusion protein)
MKKIFAYILLAAIIAVGGYSFIAKKRNNRTIVHETTQAVRTDIADQLLETGVINPMVGAEIDVGARATGVIDKLYVKVGDSVEKGQLIAQIDSRQIERNIETTKISLQLLFSQLEKQKKLMPVNIDTAKQNIEKAESDLYLAQRNYEREKKLYDSDASTDESLDDKLHQLQLAQTALKNAKTQLDITKTTFESDIKILQHQIDETNSLLKELQVQRSYYDIYATISGVVTQVAADEGETVVTGLQVASLITILQPEKLEMWIYVDETDIGKIKIGMPVNYTVDTYSGKTFHGTIDQIYLEPETNEGIVYYTAVLNIPKEDALLFKKDMTTHVKIITETKKNILAVKNGAVKWDGKDNVVYKVINKDKNEVEKVFVKTGLKSEDYTEITEGLNENDEIALKLTLPASENSSKADNKGNK